MKYKKLISFDFDDTLFHTKRPDEGKNIWLEKTGQVWPHIGWWGKSDTINLDYFECPINEWVHEKYKEHIDIEDNFIIAATGRLDKVDGMRDNVNRILHENKMFFHEVHLNTGGDTLIYKIKLFESKIKELEVDEFIMFDDRQEHFLLFEKWAIEQEIKITVVNVVTKTSKTFN